MQTRATLTQALSGVPQFRARILYVPQRPSLLPGTPRDFLNSISGFASRKAHTGLLRKKNDTAAVPDLHEPVEVAAVWGIDEELWDRNWSNLSGGESQRLALAIAVGLKTAEVLLLDGTSLDVCIWYILTPSFRTYVCVGREHVRHRGEILATGTKEARRITEGDSVDHTLL